MAFLVDDDGNFLRDDAGNFRTDDGATIINWNPETQITLPAWSVALNIAEDNPNIVNVDAIGLSAITYSLAGPDAASFDIDSGTGEVTWNGGGAGIALGDYEIDVTATNAEGDDTRTLLIHAFELNFGEAGKSVTTVALSVGVGI